VKFCTIVISSHTTTHLNGLLSFNNVESDNSTPENYYGYDQSDNLASREERTTEELLAWLNFPGMDQRREEVERAHKDTFQWIFDGYRAGAEDTPENQNLLTSDSTQPGNTSFVTWLREETGIFWIYGKPGAGKSTLMKCLMEDPRLEEQARVWAGSHELSISSFYFWKLGSKIQKSVSGLYRALLWQILNDDRSLVQTTFPGWQTSLGTVELGPKAARAALDRLMKARAPRKKYLVLIDGLDEYEDDRCNAPISQDRLCQDLSQMVESGSVKIIVASRPDRAFESHFSRGRKIAVHDLTARDIQLFAHDRLINDKTIRPSGEDLSDQETAQICWLVMDIAVKSQGVFLWTRVVVELLRVQIRDYHDMDELKATITRLPPDLEELFDQIMDRILRPGRPERIESLRYLALTSHWFTAFDWRSDWLPLSILGVGCDSELGSHNVTESWLEDNTQRLRKTGSNELRIEGRVKSCCFGLLDTFDKEVDGLPFQRPQPRTIRKGIRPLHRTLVEYLSRHAAMQNATNLSLPGHGSFDASTAILLGLVIMGESIYPLVKSASPPLAPISLVQIVLIFNKLAKESTVSAHIVLLSMLDRSVKAGFMTLVERHCHLDHDHGASCVSRSPRFKNLRTDEKNDVFAFESVVREFALNPSRPLISRTRHPGRFLDLLAITITCHSNALLKQCVSNTGPENALLGAPISAGYATRLLRYALKRKLELVQYLTAVDNVSVPNIEALQLLLRLGASLETRTDGANAWEKFLDDMVNRTMKRAIYLTNGPVKTYRAGPVPLGLDALHSMISHGARLDVHRVWAAMFQERGTSPRTRRVIEFRRFSVVQIIRQTLDTLRGESDFYQRHHALEITELERMRRRVVEQQKTISAPTRRCRWSDLQGATPLHPGFTNLDWQKICEALTITRRRDLDIVKYQRIREGSSQPTAWLPYGCRKMHELPDDLMTTEKEQWTNRSNRNSEDGRHWMHRFTFPGDGQHVNCDVVGWLVYTIE
jgi:archaellum biogenesis ATPase FlaH